MLIKKIKKCNKLIGVIAVLEICPENKTGEPVVGTFKKFFAGFCQ